VPFCQTQQLQCLYHGSTKAHLCPPFCAIPYFLYRVGDDLRYICYGFGARSAELAGAFLTLFFAWTVVTQGALKVFWKQSEELKRCNQVTHPLFKN